MSAELALSHAYQIWTHNSISALTLILLNNHSALASSVSTPSACTPEVREAVWAGNPHNLPDGVSTNCRGSGDAEDPRWFMRCSQGK